MGVEPTRERLTPPTGFEARPPHRGRVSSVCVVARSDMFGVRLAVGLVHERKLPNSANAVHVADTPQIADAIEKLKYLNRPFAPQANAIAELRGAHPVGTVFDVAHDSGQLADRLPPEEVIPHHLVDDAGVSKP
jgi:hypothetical protein